MIKSLQLTPGWLSNYQCGCEFW